MCLITSFRSVVHIILNTSHCKSSDCRFLLKNRGITLKHAFSEFARLSEREFQVFLNNAIIVFDTNVLLHLYLFSSQTLKQVFSILSDIKDQLWMPHKVGEEFYHNRAKQIEFLKTQEKLIFDALDNDSADTVLCAERHFIPDRVHHWHDFYD